MTSAAWSSLVASSSALTTLLLAPRTPARDVVIAACLCWSIVAGMIARRAVAVVVVDIAEALAGGIVPALWLVSKHGHAQGLVVVVPAFAFIGAVVWGRARIVDGAGSSATSSAAAAIVIAAVASSTLAVELGALVVGALIAATAPTALAKRWPWLLLALTSTAVLLWRAA